MTFYPRELPSPQIFKMPQDRLLIVGSGPSALMAKNLDLSTFDVVCMNNSWAAIPEPEKNIDWWYYSNDFYRRIPIHKSKGRNQMAPTKDLRKVLEIRSRNWKTRNIVDYGFPGCYFKTGYGSGLVFIDILSLIFKTLEACDRWDEIWFLGCDHDYTGNMTHFYGNSEKSYQNEDDLLGYFRLIRRAADRLGVKLNVASNNKNGLLYKGLKSNIYNINSRDGFVSIILENRYEIGVELGVAQGNYSSILAKSNLKDLYLIDKWNDHHDEEEKSVVLNRFKNDSRIHVIQKTFEDASIMFPDAYFDFIYIDGYAHTGQDNGKTLELWWPKVKPGGFFGGHDYHKKWPPTKEAIDSFFQKINMDFYLTQKDKYPSWFTILDK